MTTTGHADLPAPGHALTAGTAAAMADQPHQRLIAAHASEVREIRGMPAEPLLCSCDFVAVLRAPSWARQMATAALTAWQLPPDTVATAVLLTSELVTNAIRASDQEPGRPRCRGPRDAGRIRLTLRRLPGRVVIEVRDHDDRPPVLAEPDTDAESGRGLMLVQAYSQEWGHMFHPSGGKTVYAALAT